MYPKPGNPVKFTECFNKNQIVYDVIYNPEKPNFSMMLKKRGKNHKWPWNAFLSRDKRL